MQQVLCINCDCKSCADFRRNNYQQMGGATHGARSLWQRGNACTILLGDPEHALTWVTLSSFRLSLDWM